MSKLKSNAKNAKKSKCTESNGKYNHPKGKDNKTVKNIHVTPATTTSDMVKTAEQGDVHWARVSSDPECRMVSSSVGDLVFYIYQNIVEYLEPEDIGPFDFLVSHHYPNLASEEIAKPNHHWNDTALLHQCTPRLDLRGEHHAPYQCKHMDQHYKRHLDDLGAP
jgi:hypothetical protein